MKQNIKQGIILLIGLIIVSTQLNAQEKPFRIGVKAGFPNVLTGNIEFVTPLASNRLAFMVDYFSYAPDIEDVNIDYSYFEIGANYYFLSDGKGPYVALSYTNMNLDFTFYDIESDSNPGVYGTATAGISMNTMNVKLGAKLGGLFYFRPEIGYSFNALPKDLKIDVTFQNEPMEVHLEEIPSILTGGLIFNIGFGFSF